MGFNRPSEVPALCRAAWGSVVSGLGTRRWGVP
jgi:hypothetical protein